MLKPMNCPHHIKIYANDAHSYRDLPVRLAEFGTVYRWEQSGELGDVYKRQSAPSLSPCTRSSSSPRAVSMMTGVPGRSADMTWSCLLYTSRCV